MNIYIPLGVILALLCFFVRKNSKNAEYMFFFSMLAILAFCALRYQFGPDYDAYWAMYNGLQGEISAENYSGTGSSAELGFLIYIKMFPSFTAFIVTNAILWVLANYLVIRKYVSSHAYWIVILYMFFNTTYLKQSTVAMRSAMVSFIFIFAFWLLIRGRLKDKILFVALMLLAGQFHTTGLVLVLFAFLTPNNNSILFNKYFLIAFSLMGLVSFFLGNSLLQVLSVSIMDNVDAFERYADDEVAVGEAGCSFNTLLFTLMSIAIAFYLAWAGRKEQNREYIYIYKIALIAALVQVVFRQGMINDRYFMCFNPFYITALIHSLKTKQRDYGVIIMIFVSVISLYIFNSKLNRGYNRYFETYHTIFEAPRIP